MALLKIDHINVSFNKKRSFLTKEKEIHVLKDVSFELESGEILVLVGESGCGKTTAGRVIAGLQEVNKGNVYFENNLLYSERKKHSPINEIQFIQQDSYAALNPAKTIYESLYAAIRCSNRWIKRKEADKKIDELMNVIGLVPASEYLYKYPHNLSGGQRQRILMARAMCFNPKLIIADEPVSMIDVSLRISILKMMKALNKEKGIAFIYITHDLSTAKFIGDKGKICVMYLGEIVEKGNLNKIIDNPKHPYTQALLKAVPDLYNVSDEKLPLKSMELASIEERPEGCSFRSRCPYECDICAKHISIKNIDGVEVLCCKGRIK